MNAPSGRSPKCSSSTSRTRSESVPGTANVFESSGASRELAKPPSDEHDEPEQRAPATRCRSTKRVQRAPRLQAVARSGYGYGRWRAADVDKLHEEIEELFADLWQVPRFSGLRRGFRPNVDCFHTDDPHELTVVVELPGVDPGEHRASSSASARS